MTSGPTFDECRGPRPCRGCPGPCPSGGQLLLEKWKKPGQLRLVGATAVFADFEGLGIFDLRRLVLAIPLLQLEAETIGDGLITPGETVPDLLMPLLLL